MKQNAQPRDRARDLVRAARSQARNPNSAPSIREVLLTSLWAEVEGDSVALKFFASLGFDAAIRDLLKKYQTETGGADDARQLQLSLYLPKLRPLVEQIDRDRVYVPSVGEFVELVPDAITVPQMREAGHYLIGQGQDTIRRGNLLLRLADEMDAA
jgi:hypothetical protein